MTNLLAFDSLHIIKPLRLIYLFVLRRKLNSKKKNTLILYRLDQDNVFLRHKRNLSGLSLGIHQNRIDALSLKFYRYLEHSNELKKLSFKNQSLYDLYTRQTKLKLGGVLKCAFRLKNFVNDSNHHIDIFTDRQTASIMKKAFMFLDQDEQNIIWSENNFLTFIISLNSIFMRLASIGKMVLTYSSLPKTYYRKIHSPELPTVLIALPRRRPEDFYHSYIKDLEDTFNIILYSHGYFRSPLNGYNEEKIIRTKGILSGLFNSKLLFSNWESYIADILLIFKFHFNLSTSIDVVNSLFANKIDMLINRQQTNVVDNYLAIKARKKKIFILGDLFEEIFFCDTLVCSSESQNTETVKLALSNSSKIYYKGSNSLIKYRLEAFQETKKNYLKQLLDIKPEKQVVFYASDPSKEESQRYLSETFLIEYFSDESNYVLVMKTHTQDLGRITYNAFEDVGSPSNVLLVGDSRQKSRIVSNDFYIFEDFDFNAAVSSCDGFLTTSSSSVLQALVLGVKSGIVDIFNNGYYDYLVNYDASLLINDESSLANFLNIKTIDVSDEVLKYCGLKNKNENFDMTELMLNCLQESQVEDAK